jgi:hypothetical protein
MEEGLVVWDGTAGANEVGMAVLIESACCSIYMMCVLKRNPSLSSGHAVNETGWNQQSKDGKKLDRW